MVGGRAGGVVRRAVDVAIPKSEIRDAILACAAQVQPDGRGFRLELQNLKEVGRELGILQSADLPKVPISTARRRH